MTQHKHSEMIKAKVDDMELVVFRLNDDGSWDCMGRNSLPHLSSYQYFLCLPQHKEACLHWLNGGDVQLQDFPTNLFVDYFNQLSSWSPELWWMSEQCNILIKPKKEKRWIAYDNGRLGVLTFHTEQGVRNQYENEESVHLQFIEIEIEV